MKILIIVASRHGATREIAEQMAEVLSAEGALVSVRSADEPSNVSAFDAVIIGSAVYMGRWLEAARLFVTENLVALARRPVWFFSSGPIGDPPRPASGPEDVAGLAAAVGARGHRLFAGRLAKRDLNLGERVVAAAVGAPEGDFRDFEAIRAYGMDIACALDLEAGPGVTGGDGQVRAD